MKRAAFLSCAGATLIGMPAGAASLRERIGSIARALPGVLGVYARTLAEGPPLAAYNASERFPHGFDHQSARHDHGVCARRSPPRCRRSSSTPTN